MVSIAFALKFRYGSSSFFDNFSKKNRVFTISGYFVKVVPGLSRRSIRKTARLIKRLLYTVLDSTLGVLRAHGEGSTF